MTTPERVSALIASISYIVDSRIPGDIVECGVWRGGSMMAAALALDAVDEHDRDLYLFDTFEGMTPPTDQDIRYDGTAASDIAETRGSAWCLADLADVRTNMESVAYAGGEVHFIKGRVEETIPRQAPAELALLRLDTDFYESTRHGMEHLFPRLAPGGVLIIDDYGYWEGARKAVDEYFQQQGMHPFIARVDSACRLVIVPNRLKK
jgi:hypothetical protein